MKGVKTMADWCWLKEGCPCMSGGCLGSKPTDDGCPIYRWFRDVFVKHGKWIDEHCSKCGKYVHIGDADNYCPHCGAKMDLGSEETDD